MAPAIFVDNQNGKVRLVIGAAGGTRITTTVAQVTTIVAYNPYIKFIVHPRHKI